LSGIPLTTILPGLYMKDSSINEAGKDFLAYDKKINSRLSFKLLLDALKKNIDDGNPGVKKLYGHVVERMEACPDLLQPITDLSVLEPHHDLITELLASLFPPTASAQENLYAVSLPFKFDILYSSKLFKYLFLKPGTNEINIPDTQTGLNLTAEKLHFAYRMILKKYCGHHLHQTSGTIHPYIDPHSGLTKYMELSIDARFVDVNPVEGNPDIPKEIFCNRTSQQLPLEELAAHIPIDKFVFDGIAIVHVHDVTEREVISLIKNSLLNINAFSDGHVYQELETHIQSLLGLKDVKIGITPFFKVNGHYVYSELHNSNSLLFKHFHSIADKDEVSECCKLLLRDKIRPIVFETLDEKVLAETEYLQYYHAEGGRSLILCPLKQNGELLGILEIVSDTAGRLKHHHIDRIEAALPLFTLALEKSAEALDNEIDRVIKEQFTAVQPAVEWKFTEAAMNFIVARRKKENPRIEKISFPDVYPLYGSVDIRNSSTERSHAIQLDLIEQLEMAKKVIQKAQASMNFPLLQEIEYKIDKFITSASGVLMSEEETGIADFLQGQVVTLFHHLHNTQTVVRKEIEQYFAALDPQLKMIYHHRRDYEQSISKINEALAQFIDREEAAAQKVFPHYFERYMTDGMEFNIYIGQSITPRKKFDEIYLRNMRMWQLTVLAKAARLTYDLEKELSHPLKTTQLILAHSIPLSIMFRTEERKFDVDGAYNIRYEIIKKRIDKVRIKDTNERLTQPGKIGIVYSQPREADEYLEYIDFLQNQQLLKSGVEHFDLEELQGVVGLRALRTEVNLETTGDSPTKIQLSGTTTKELLGR
jgi:hypothetical protein